MQTIYINLRTGLKNGARLKEVLKIIYDQKFSSHLNIRETRKFSSFGLREERLSI